jgi:transketolase N-terminal domain/subunit
MLDYVEVLFKEHIVTPTDGIVIGKPFGAQAYYVVWEELGYITNINQLSVGVKHDEIPFVDYAIGIALTTHKRIWVNLSDASLQMGNILEAIQFIGQHNLRNIFVTIDYNNAQVTGRTNDIISVNPCKSFFTECGWIVHSVNGHNKQELSKTFNSLDASHPNVVFCNTRKGNGVQCMVEDIQKWHYRKISSLEELESML